MLDCDIAIVGGGASGFFTAANLDLKASGLSCILFEGASKPLAKVRVSGGGRCNVTHHEFDVNRLVEHYPRGHRELRGPFSRFQPRDMIRWLEQRGVFTKVEADGRMFPVSNDSGDIVRCLMRSVEAAGATLRMGYRLTEVEYDAISKVFCLRFKNGTTIRCQRLILATGGHSSGLQVAEKLGHTIVEPTPSLFTFNVKDDRLDGLSGMSFEHVELKLRIGKKTFTQSGPLLITHWGLSGPAILKLSAWAAKDLAEVGYQGFLEIDFAPQEKRADVEEMFIQLKLENGSKQCGNLQCNLVPRRYWQRLTDVLKLEDKKMAHVGKRELLTFTQEMKQARFQFHGKSTNKDEFVTAGGVKTNEVDMKSMESKRVSGLFFTGELLNIDGVTGGFNFQNAWTSGYLCAMRLNEI